MKELDKLKQHKMPEGSVFYDRLMPILFAVLAVVTIGLILFAIGIFTGLIAWS